MSGVDVALDTPLSDFLQTTVQLKLVESGWTTESVEDSALAEYIVLLLVNGKNQDEVAADVQDMLEGCDSNGAKAFASWLFKQAREFIQESNASQQQESLGEVSLGAGLHIVQPQTDGTQNDPMQDSSMTASVPTGPKSMRNGNQRTRGQRLLGQVNSALNRSGPDQTLHRVKGAAGAGRINTHDRNTPRGPKGAAQQRNNIIRGMGNGMAGGMAGMPPGMGSMSPQQQMQMFALYEEQARMMAQILSPQQQQSMFPMQMAFNGQNGVPAQPPQQGKSLFERIENPPSGHNNHHNQGQNSYQDGTSIDPTSSMEVEPDSQRGPKPDPSNSVCKFNLSCTRPDCTFAHQSPAAPPGTTIDMEDTCSFGVACKNRKCTGKHPSPAGKGSHLSEVDCKYFPNCTNPSCPYKHPSMPPCRNGADCTVQNCKFSHSKVVCKYDPCLNPACPFKHVVGQKRGTYHDKVWINTEDEAHVSERRFVDDEANEAEEELILPGQDNVDTVQAVEGIIA